MAYWRCRRLWPGAGEFGPERFGALPCGYVVDAISEGERLRRMELHDEELPVANLAALTANINRDPEGRKEPYRLQDFAFYGEQEDVARVAPRAGAAFRAAGMAGLLPAWALFCWEGVTAGAPEEPQGGPLLAAADGVLMVAPVEVGGMLQGLLVARQDASGQTVELSTTEGQCYRVRIPDFPDHVMARDGEALEILPAPTRRRRRRAAVPGRSST